jgi:hypothetical protein
MRRADFESAQMRGQSLGLASEHLEDSQRFTPGKQAEFVLSVFFV